jgi:hypothetical protein
MVLLQEKSLNNDGKQIITINTEKPWDISSDGNAEFDVYLDQTVNQL